MTALGFDRRRFLGTATAIAGAYCLGWSIPARAAAAAEGGRELGIWVVIEPDDTAVIRIARSEMGQGTLTGLAQLVAEELEADWAKLRAEYISPDENLARQHAWGDMSTGGSRGLRGSVDYVRQGGAAARSMLVQAAAARWSVPAAECQAENSRVLHGRSGRSLGYGTLAADAAALPVPESVTLKSPAQWKLIGKAVARLDTPPKLEGSLVYASDVRLPGMLNAAIAQCPVFGGKLVSFDAAALSAMPGVRHVVAVDDNSVAVVADTWWQARTALDRLPIVWDEGANATVSSADIDAWLREGLTAAQAALGQRQGDVAAGLAGAATRIEAVYSTPFLSHATMEPMNATALFTGNALEVWVASQNGDAALAAAAEAAGLDPSQVKVHKHHLGGGFGRRGQQDYVRQAVLIARQIPGRPVKLLWSREEDTRHDFYRPATQCRLQGGLDANGDLVALHARLSGPSILASLAPARLAGGVDKVAFQGWLAEEFGYRSIPNLLIDHAVRNTHVPVGFWRGVNTNQNTIFMECFIDELADAAGRDKLEFRRSLLARSPKHLAVLEAVAERAGWGTPAPPGVFRGLAQNCCFGSYVAAVAEVSVADDGKLTIHRIVAGTDPGHAVNPDQIAAQVEGSFVYGLSALLYSENTVKDGRIVEGNFDTYQVMRLADMPKVETVLVPSGGFWGGVGEPTIAVAAPAVLNAIAAATGRRVRRLPLKDQDLRLG